MNLAHRGASAYAPENTRASFDKGIELGANGIETDLQKTSDGVIFLFHDDRLDNKTNAKGRPIEYSWAELRRLDAGSWFSPEYKDERLLSLEEFLRRYGTRPLLLALELKVPFVGEEVEGILQLVDLYDVRERVTLTSFLFDNLATTRQVDAEIRIGYLVRRIDIDVIRQLTAIDAQQICPSADLITAEDVSLAKEHGLEVRAWGVENIDLMNHALNCQVDGMTLDSPDALRKRQQV